MFPEWVALPRVLVEPFQDLELAAAGQGVLLVEVPAVAAAEDKLPNIYDCKPSKGGLFRVLMGPKFSLLSRMGFRSLVGG